MKQLRITAYKVLLASSLAVGFMMAGPVSADTSVFVPGDMLLASTDYKGVHPNKPHVVYERQVKNNQLLRAEEEQTVPLADFSGKPPYKRHTAEQHLERVQFARLEEGAGAVEHQHSIYRGSQGNHPPYKRSW